MLLLLAGVGQSEPVDWLGLTRLGSPDAATRDAAEKPSVTAAGGRDIGRQSDPSDGPAAASARRTTVSSRLPKTDQSDSRRGSLYDDKAEKISPEWLEMAADRSAEKKPLSSSGRKSLDSTQDDDWLGITRSTSKRADSASDYLGLGSEIDLTQKPQRFSTYPFLVFYFKN